MRRDLLSVQVVAGLLTAPKSDSSVIVDWRPSTAPSDAPGARISSRPRPPTFAPARWGSAARCEGFLRVHLMNCDASSIFNVAGQAPVFCASKGSGFAPRPSQQAALTVAPWTSSVKHAAAPSRNDGSSFRRLTSAAPGATPPPAGAAGAAPCGGAKFGMACCGIICIGIAPVVCSGMAPPPPIWSAMVARCLRRCPARRLVELDYTFRWSAVR